MGVDFWACEFCCCCSVDIICYFRVLGLDRSVLA